VTPRGRSKDRAASTAKGKGGAAASSSEAVLSEAPKPIELVFGFIGPTGVDLDKVCEALTGQLKSVGYETQTVSLSRLIQDYCGKASFPSHYERVNELMNRGNELRRQSGHAEIVASMGIVEIRNIRKSITGDPKKTHNKRRIAYVVRSFKRPEEVELYRGIYGKAFTLISVYSSRSSRLQSLAKRCLSTRTETAEERAIRLANRDDKEEGEKFGQRVGRTFPLADYFVTAESRPTLDEQLKRLVRLTFGDPYISPTRDEQGMFFAQASALRSLDLSRQVGAAILTTDGDIVSTGCNEVPKFGGGLYWGEDKVRDRDFERGVDSNVVIKTELVEDAVRRLRDQGWLREDQKERTDEELAKAALFGEKAFFRDSKLFDVIEFGRSVHAEMAAISQAARLGVSLQGSRLFCTTFPCHICARHIVAAGIREVVFVEPYEKSRTAELYSDSIVVEPHETSSVRANFKPFVGVAPRRYMDFFQLSGERKTDDGKILKQNDIAAEPRLKRIVLTYLLVEQKVVDELVLPEVEQESHSEAAFSRVVPTAGRGRKKKHRGAMA
jgi:deoxycytidylate deaminase